MENDNHDENNQEPGKPNAYRVDDDDNLEEKDLTRTFLFGDAKMKSVDDPGMEGKGMGGQNFGNNNLTPAGNDKDNPPQNAGENNEYFKRTQPAEEHPEDENFVAPGQEGGPGAAENDYPNSDSNKHHINSTDGVNKIGSHPNAQQEYTEGTADEDGPAI